jgi:hypothetical protein
MDLRDTRIKLITGQHIQDNFNDHYGRCRMHLPDEDDPDEMTHGRIATHVESVKNSSR